VRITLARVVTAGGAIATDAAGAALAVFWADYHLWRDLSRIDGNDDLEAPSIEAYGREGLVLRVDGRAAPRECDACGWPMLRDVSLDEPMTVTDGSRMGGEWRGHRCAADPGHTHMEPR
jgi:hypothetical protein